MATIAIADLHPSELENEMITLADVDQTHIQGGGIGAAIVGGAAVATLGVTAYMAFTTEKERIRHRNAVVSKAKEIHNRKGEWWSFV
jgi:hypothetical protein